MTRITIAALALALAFSPARGPATAAAAAPAGERIVAIGDIHGALDGLVEILRAAGLIDANRRWIGGRARLVQTGDFTDRGAAVREVMDLLMRLESEARRAGGRVDVLFGNHEGMNVLRDFRDVSPEAFAAFADSRSEDRRKRALAAHQAAAARSGAVVEDGPWMAAHPPGYVEYAEAMGKSGRYGRWIRARRTIVEIDGTIFMHAGIAPDTAGTIEDINRSVEEAVRTWDALVERLEAARLVTSAFGLQDVVNAAQVEIGRIVTAQKTGEPLPDHVTRELVAALQRLPELPSSPLIDGEGPLWYRGLATLPEAAQPQVAALLRRLGAERFVVGHTTQLPEGRITRRLDGRVYLIDTGMLNSVYKGGSPSALEIADGQLTAIYPSSREPLESPRSSAAGPVKRPLP